jgi:hypothetical protein
VDSMEAPSEDGKKSMTRVMSYEAVHEHTPPEGGPVPAVPVAQLEVK